jgi:fatty acid elongase 3
MQYYLVQWHIGFAAVAVYLWLLWSIRGHVQKRGKPYDLKTFVIIHNALLSIASAWLLWKMVAEVSRMISVTSFWRTYCDEKAEWGNDNKGYIYDLYYYNYIFKYIELLDTVLLALRGKPMTFLHVYHHSATLILCLSQILGESCLQWVVICINLLVHVIMYGYYSLQAAGVPTDWFKKGVTTMQIGQFVIVKICCWSALVPRFLAYVNPTSFSNCHGNLPAAFFGLFILTSYLVLFIQLYNEIYNGKRKKKQQQTSTQENVDNTAFSFLKSQ